MLSRMVVRAVEQRIGTSKLVDNFKDAYDYIIGLFVKILFTWIFTGTPKWSLMYQ